jgi:hypothetical protein
VKNNEPKLAIRRSLPSSTPPEISQMRKAQATALNTLNCVSISPTTTECIVGSNFSLITDVWTHIAGVLVDESHVHTMSEICTNVVMAQRPHLDIYVNGMFSNCATSEEDFSGEASIVTSAGVIGDGDIVIDDDPNVEDDEITTQTRFNGVVDDLRLWGVARTQDQIIECMDRELSFEGEECIIDHTILNTYWRLNEGNGHDVKDISGNGINGGIESGPPIQKFEDGWVDGAPIIKK